MKELDIEYRFTMFFKLEYFVHVGLNRVLQSWHSTVTFDEFEEKNEIEDGDFINDRKELEPQGVDPKKGWGFRGVHKVILLFDISFEVNDVCSYCFNLFSHSLLG